MKKWLSFGLCLLLCGCSANATVSKNNINNLNTNVIEVSASSVDEVEELAMKDVKDTKEKLENERDDLGKKITDFDSYMQNKNKVKDYYDNALKQTELLSIRLREYTYKYADLILSEDTSYKVKYKDLSGIYEYIYNDAGKAMYEIYSKTIRSLYDTYYNGIIKDAYDTVDYDVWSDASSQAYEDWSDCLSDIYEVWSDMGSDIYEFQSDLRSEIYDHDDERAQKKMIKFKKAILRMKEDVDD